MTTSNVEYTLEHEIAKTLPKLQRHTLWEDVVRIAWSLVGIYFLVVLAFTLYTVYGTRPKTSRT